MLSYDTRSESCSSLTLEDRSKLEQLKQKWPVPKCESKRLQVLRETKLIGSDDESEVYGRFTHLVNRLFKVPVVLISLIDVDRQWFKAKVGMEGRSELPRKGSLCNRILLEESSLVIATEDVKRDMRFVGCNVNWVEPPTDISGVTTPPRNKLSPTNAQQPQFQSQQQPPSPALLSVRFYAAVALVVDGMKVGSLSLYDTVPRRDLVEKALKLLPDFGSIISDAMDRRHKLQLGSGSELAELSMSVMYNLKFPLTNMQTTLGRVGEYTAFQPAKRVTRVPVTAVPNAASSSLISCATYSGSVACTCACASVCAAVPSSSGAAAASPSAHSVASPTASAAATAAMLIDRGMRAESLDGDSHGDHQARGVRINVGEGVGVGVSGSLSRSGPTSPFSELADGDAAPLSPGASGARDAGPPATPTTAASAAPGTTCGPHCIHATAAAVVAATAGKTRYKKIINKDALRAEMEDLLDQMLELRRKGATLIKVLDHSLALAHSLQAQHQRRKGTTSAQQAGTHNVMYSSASAQRRHAEDASQEKMYNNLRMYNRLRKIYRNCAKSPLCSADMTYTVDPVLVHCQENDGRRYQFSSRALMLASYSCIYHASRLLPHSRIGVHVHFEEREPASAALLQRVTSPPTNQGGIISSGSNNSSRLLAYAHQQAFGAHKQLVASSIGSPSSAKTIVESGKQTRLSSFTTAGLQHFMALTGSSSSDGDVNTRDSVEYNHINAHHILLAGSRRSSVDEATVRASPDLLQQGQGHTSTGSSPEKKPFPIPSPIQIPAFFTSPRTSIHTTKTASARSLHSVGDLVISVRCCAKGSNNHTPTVGAQSGKEHLSADERARKDALSSKALIVETATFENTILRNILSTVSGGFLSTSGSGFNPEAPTTAGQVGAMFAPGADGSTLQSFNPHEMLEEIREDSGSDGEVYMVTVRIPCNIISPVGDHLATASDGANSKDSGTTSTAKDAPRTPQQMRVFQPVELSGAVDSVVLRRGTSHTKPQLLSAIPSIRSLTTASNSSRNSHSGSSKKASLAEFGASTDLADSCKTAQGTITAEQGSAAHQTLTLSLRAKPSSSVHSTAAAAGGGAVTGLFSGRSTFSFGGNHSAKSGDGASVHSVAGAAESGSAKAALAVRQKQQGHTVTAGAVAVSEEEDAALVAQTGPQQRQKPKPGHSSGTLQMLSPAGLFTAIGNASRAVLSLGGASQRKKVATETTIRVTASSGAVVAGHSLKE